MNLAVCVLVLWKWNCVRWLLSVITLWLFAFRLKKIYRWLRSGSDHLFCVLPCCFPQKATRKTDKVRPTELDVTALSDKSLRDELLERGLDVGPIVGECNPAHHCRHRSGHRDCTHCAFVKWQMQTVPGENWLQRGCCTKNVVALVVSKVAEIAYSLLDCLQTAFILWAVVKLEKIRKGIDTSPITGLTRLVSLLQHHPCLVLPASTRKLYEKKLQKLLDEGPPQPPPPQLMLVGSESDLYSDREDGRKDPRCSSFSAAAL